MPSYTMCRDGVDSVTTAKVHIDFDRSVIGVEYAEGYSATENIPESDLLNLLAQCIVDEYPKDEDNSAFSIWRFDIPIRVSVDELIDNDTGVSVYATSITTGRAHVNKDGKTEIYPNPASILYQVQGGKVIWSSCNGKVSSILDDSVDSDYDLAFSIRDIVCYLKLRKYISPSRGRRSYVYGSRFSRLYHREYPEDPSRWIMPDFWDEPNSDDAEDRIDYYDYVAATTSTSHSGNADSLGEEVPPTLVRDQFGGGGDDAAATGGQG